MYYKQKVVKIELICCINAKHNSAMICKYGVLEDMRR
jgi:hypothetical protein